MEQARFERRVIIDVPVDEAWSRVVDRFPGWFGSDAALDPRPGGSVVSGRRAGHVTVLEEGRRLVWEWSSDGDPGWTEVSIVLSAEGEQTVVEVTEVLFEWEQATHEAIDGRRPGPVGILGVAV